MLSSDELSDGVPFILKLWDAVGVASCWVETLRGDTARHWYNILRGSDWAALRAEAGGVFQLAVSEEQAEYVRSGLPHDWWALQTDSIMAVPRSDGDGKAEVHA